MRRTMTLVSILAVGAAAAAAQKASFTSYPDALPVLQAFAQALPTGLATREPAARAAAWPAWVARRDAEIRGRLRQGEEDSLANLLMFGTSFTPQPRITPEYMAELEKGDRLHPEKPPVGADALARAFLSRVDDLTSALSRPRDDERLLLMRHLVEGKGYALDQAAGRERLRQYLLANLARVRREYGDYAKELAAARARGDATEELAVRSRLFRDRGIALDTSLPPNFAIEESLAALLARGLLLPGGVRRAAVVGPGLDFVDKQEGYDFYPPQTVQPFALVDTLLRLGLSRLESLEMTTFDISARVNDHLSRARQRAGAGRGYVVQLPLDATVPWKPEAVRYWERFGDQVGSKATPVPVPEAAGPVRVRAVSVRPQVVSLIRPVDMNVVWQRLEVAPGEAFDLVVATNVLVYYDTFEQCLALANLERMLRPGGLLLSNNAVLELPASRLRSAGYQTVVYSDRPSDGDHIVWYRRSDDAAPP